MFIPEHTESLSQENLRAQYSSIVTLAAITAFFFCLRIVRHILDWNVFFIVARTLAQAMRLILAFTCILMLQMVGFSLLFHVVFGAGIFDFRSGFVSMLTIFRFLLGDFERVVILMEGKGPVGEGIWRGDDIIMDNIQIIVVQDIITHGEGFGGVIIS